MKLLVVMRYFPWPPRTGSALVAYYSIKELAKRHSISLVCREKPVDAGDVACDLEEMHFPEPDAVPTPGPLTKLAAMTAGTPALIYNSASLRMQEAVAVRFERFDALILFEMQAIQYCPPDSYGMVVANIEDPPSLKSTPPRRDPTCPSRPESRSTGKRSSPGSGMTRTGTCSNGVWRCGVKVVALTPPASTPAMGRAGAASRAGAT
jgi:hypothetical protein